MEQIKFKAVCKNLNGGKSTSEVTFDTDNEVTYITSTVGPQITSDDIVSGTATQGQVLTADGLGGTGWADVDIPESVIPNPADPATAVLGKVQIGDTIYDIATAEKLDAPVYDSTATYDVGDFVSYNNRVYICETAVTVAEEFDPNKWDEITISEGVLGMINEGY